MASAVPLPASSRPAAARTAMEPKKSPRVNAAQFQLAGRDGATEDCALAQGRMSVRALPGDRQIPKEREKEPQRNGKRATKQEVQRDNKHEALRAVQAANHEPRRETGSPMPDAVVELPPLIRRQEV